MRPELALFAQFMETKLKLNDHKGGWEKCSIEDLFTKLQSEVDELRAAIEAEPNLNVAFEAADIANFAMMIAWNVMREQFINSVPQNTEPSPAHSVCDKCRNVPFEHEIEVGSCPDTNCINNVSF